MALPTASPIARSAALVTLLLLVLGLPRFLVLCTPASGAPHLEMICAAGCCDHDDAAFAQDDGDEPEPGDTNLSGGCVHHDLGVELGQPPVKPAFDTELTITAELTPVEIGPRLDGEPLRVWTFATGPPRPGRTIALRRSTELRE